MRFCELLFMLNIWYSMYYSTINVSAYVQTAAEYRTVVNLFRLECNFRSNVITTTNRFEPPIKLIDSNRGCTPQ